ncbi:MAG: two-component system chemotaxis response regulator CheY [Paraglaciecola sp.]|jgi:two-component system chemotaxis response regulator CheY
MKTYTPKKNILIIDDQKSIRFLLGAMLSKQYAVTTKRDGLEGMAWMSRGNIPDLILLDMQMPRLCGSEFLKSLKNSGLFKNIPVIVLSGNESDAEISNCFEMGAQEYLKKPFNPVQLKDKISSIFQPNYSII